jgi:hypothetical protein
MESMRKCGGSSGVGATDDELVHAERTTSVRRGGEPTQKNSLNVESRKKISGGPAEASLRSTA